MKKAETCRELEGRAERNWGGEKFKKKKGERQRGVRRTKERCSEQLREKLQM